VRAVSIIAIFGAVIDERMGDEIRITVIATGFGEVQREVKKPGFSLQKEAPMPGFRATPQRTVARDRDASRPVVHLGTIIDDLESPTYLRHKPAAENGNGNGGAKDTQRAEDFTIADDSEDQFEIPAFLRKNAG
jgi:hypothetical protein